MRRTPQHAYHANAQPEPLGALSGARVVASPPVMEAPVNSVATRSPEVQTMPILEAVAPGQCCPLLPCVALCCPSMPGCCQSACPLLPARHQKNLALHENGSL